MIYSTEMMAKKNESETVEDTLPTQDDDDEDDVALNKLSTKSECRLDEMVNCSSVMSCGGFGSREPSPMCEEEESKIWECSDITLNRHKYIWIVTTAALPWRTGTAMNPLLRALYLIKMSKKEVTLVIPWLTSAGDRHQVYKGHSFQTTQDQEKWIRHYAETSCNLTGTYKKFTNATTIYYCWPLLSIVN